MSKHRLSPAPLPPSKRLHTLDGTTPTNSGLKLSFESALYDELILCIFSHLSYLDLCVTQSTSRNWARLAADNELWRELYLKVFGRPRLRGTRGFIRNDGREVKALPGRAKVDDQHRDWKWMFRISSNWKNGRCAVEGLNEYYSPSSHESARTLVLLAGSLTITASSAESLEPAVQIHNTYTTHSIICRSARRDRPVSITALTLDQSQPVSGHLRLLAFLSTGEFIVYTVPSHQPAAVQVKLTYRNPRASVVTHAVYHHPLLVTLSEAFALSIYDLSSYTAVLRQTLHPLGSYPPTSLVLSKTSCNSYRLVLAYAIPVYPSHWSVGASELIISGLNPTSPQTLLSSSPALGVVSTRYARTTETPQGWIDQRKLRVIREQWSRKVLRVADTQTDGKWVVLAPWDIGMQDSQDSHLLRSAVSKSPYTSLHSPITLQLYRLSFPSLTSATPKLTFVRNLTGQTGPISAIALADGRCVSVGVNGIWAWDLEAGTGAEVSGPSSPPVAALVDSVIGRRTVVFDERRIITAEAGKMIVRRFDI